MKLAGKYRIVVEGDIDQLRIGYNTGIGYLFERLLTGEVAYMENLSNWGITVTQEPVEEPPCFVIDPTPEELRAMDDEALFDVYDAVVEYDASGDRVRRKVRREIDRRRKEEGS